MWNTDNSKNEDFWIQRAIDEIESTYGDVVSVVAKKKTLLKFGRSGQIQTSKSTVMTLPTGVFNETYCVDNDIDTISSSNGGDTEILTIEGHTIDGDGNFTFVVQSKALTGQTKAVLDTPLARLTRMYNGNGTDLIGDIYGYEDTPIVNGVPTDGTKVHCMIPAGLNQSEKCATTISNIDYWIIMATTGDVLEKTSATGEFHLELRLKGKIFRDTADFSAESGNGGGYNYLPYKIIPKNSDVRMRAEASANNKEFAASIQGILATIV